MAVESLTPEQIDERRAGIEKYLAERILRTSVYPSDPTSEYSQAPQNNPEVEDAWDRALGSPVLYAIYCAAENARNNLADAYCGGSDDEIRQSKEELRHIKELEAYWHDPASSPFDPVKPIEF